MTEEDFETRVTECVSEDLYDKLMEMTGWTVKDKEKGFTLLCSCLIKCVQRDPRFFYLFFFIKVADSISYVFPAPNIGQTRSIGSRLPT